MICFLNCFDNQRSHLCYCRMARNGFVYAIRHEPEHFPLHMSISAIAMPASNSSDETSRWNCETERTSSTATDFGVRGAGDDLRNAMSDGDLLDCTTPYSHYPFMSARGMDFVFEKHETRIPICSHEPVRRRRISLAQISQVSVDSNFSARPDQPRLKVERIRLRSINCKLSAKLEIRRRAERRRIKENKSSDSSDSESALFRSKTSSASIRRTKRTSPPTSVSRLTSSSSAEENENKVVSEELNSSVDNLSADLRLFSVHNGEANESPKPQSPHVPYLQLNMHSDSSSRQSGSTKREDFEKLSYEKEMQKALKKEDEVQLVDWESPQRTSVRSTPRIWCSRETKTATFDPLRQSDFMRTKQKQWHEEQSTKRTTIFEENIDFVTDEIVLPIANCDQEDNESVVENNRSEGSEIIIDISTSIKPEIPVVDVEEPSSSLHGPTVIQTNDILMRHDPHRSKKGNSDGVSNKRRRPLPTVATNWSYEMSMCKLLRVLFHEKERLETSIASTNKHMPLPFTSARCQLAQEKYRQHLRENLRKVENRIDAILNQLAKSKNKEKSGLIVNSGGIK